MSLSHPATSTQVGSIRNARKLPNEGSNIRVSTWARSGLAGKCKIRLEVVNGINYVRRKFYRICHCLSMYGVVFYAGHFVIKFFKVVTNSAPW